MSEPGAGDPRRDASLETPSLDKVYMILNKGMVQALSHPPGDRPNALISFNALYSDSAQTDRAVQDLTRMGYDVRREDRSITFNASVPVSEVHRLAKKFTLFKNIVEREWKGTDQDDEE